MKKKISVIIAAYNEEPRIAKVLKVVEHHPLIDEVIVVNDGSKDKTSEVVKTFGVTLIENEKNMGKTLSVKRGVEAAKNDLVMLLDADLNGLTQEALSKLAQPVLDKKVDWTLSLRGNSFGIMKMIKMDWVSGERVIPKELLKDPLIWSRSDISYGLETLMNKSLMNQDASFCSVYLPDLIISNKADKIGFWKGWVGEFKMVGQISKVMPLHKVIGQSIKMARLSSKYRRVMLKNKYSEA
jgi:glycosyltransferase involved in cell wall biosynthesis